MFLCWPNYDVGVTTSLLALSVFSSKSSAFTSSLATAKQNVVYLFDCSLPAASYFEMEKSTIVWIAARNDTINTTVRRARQQAKLYWHQRQHDNDFDDENDDVVSWIKTCAIPGRGWWRRRWENKRRVINCRKICKEMIKKSSKNKYKIIQQTKEKLQKRCEIKAVRTT